MNNFKIIDNCINYGYYHFYILYNPLTLLTITGYYYCRYHIVILLFHKKEELHRLECWQYTINGWCSRNDLIIAPLNIIQQSRKRGEVVLAINTYPECILKTHFDLFIQNYNDPLLKSLNEFNNPPLISPATYNYLVKLSDGYEYRKIYNAHKRDNNGWMIRADVMGVVTQFKRVKELKELTHPPIHKYYPKFRCKRYTTRQGKCFKGMNDMREMYCHPCNEKGCECNNLGWYVKCINCGLELHERSAFGNNISYWVNENEHTAKQPIFWKFQFQFEPLNSCIVQAIFDIVTIEEELLGLQRVMNFLSVHQYEYMDQTQMEKLLSLIPPTQKRILQQGLLL